MRSIFRITKGEMNGKNFYPDEAIQFSMSLGRLSRHYGVLGEKGVRHLFLNGR